MNKKRNTLLIIDDNDDTLDLLEIFLYKDYDISIAHNGFDGLNKAAEELPDCIITDIMMPIMNGYEVCARLRLEEKTQNIPVILLSSAYTTDTVRQAKVSGGSGYVAKPFTPSELMTEIRKLLPQIV